MFFRLHIAFKQKFPSMPGRNIKVGSEVACARSGLTTVSIVSYQSAAWDQLQEMGICVHHLDPVLGVTSDGTSRAQYVARFNVYVF